jgi:NTP pyrophosphatase (non-canonical NTP hydrolase)
MILKEGADPVKHAAMGLSAEAGEVLDLFKKSEYDGAPDGLPINKVLDEMGDVLWYLSYLALAFGFSLEELAQMNYEKLHERHPARYPAL